jgi:hypothetical protein
VKGYRATIMIIVISLRMPERIFSVPSSVQNTTIKDLSVSKGQENDAMEQNRELK